MSRSLVFLLFLLFPLGQLVKVSLWGKVSVLPQELIIVLLLLQFVFSYKIKKLPDLPLVKEIGLFSGLALLSLFLSPLQLSLPDFLEAAAYLIRFLLYFSLWVILMVELKNKTLTKEFLTGGLIFSAAIFSILGLMQFFLYPSLANISYLGWDVHYGRLVSTFLDPGFSGLIFVLAFLLTLSSCHRGRSIIFYYGLLFFFLFSLLLTYSRSSWLAMTVGLIIYQLVKREFKLPLFFLALLLIGILIVPKPIGEGGNLTRTASSLARVSDWQISLSLWRHAPVLGLGFDAYRFARIKYGFVPPNRPEVAGALANHSLAGADNSFLFVLVTTGFVGLALFLYLGFQAARNLRAEKAVILASFGAIAVHSLFQNSLFYPFVLEWIWILAAMTMNTSRAG